jgi:hypothetical protein
MSTGGEVANALVCKTSIRGFNSRPVLQIFGGVRGPGTGVPGSFSAVPAGLNHVPHLPRTVSWATFNRPFGTFTGMKIVPSAAKAEFIAEKLRAA